MNKYETYSFLVANFLHLEKNVASEEKSMKGQLIILADEVDGNVTLSLLDSSSNLKVT